MIGRILALSAIGGFIIGILPVEAGDNAMTALVPEVWAATVFEVTCGDLGDCCGVHRECGGFATGPLPPAPVPLNGTGLFTMSALVALAAIRLNMKERYK